MRIVHAALLAIGLALGVGAPSAALAADGPAIVSTTHDPTSDASEVEVPWGWETVQRRHVRVHSPARHRGLSEALADHAEASIPRLSERLRMGAGGVIDVFVSTTDAQFREVQPGSPPSYAAATAYPALGAIYLKAPGAQGQSESLTETFDHELVHILVGRAFAPGHPPSWLQEGLAQFHGEATSNEDLSALASASISGPIPLDDLERAFPENPHQAGLAYAESLDFLMFLDRTWGPEAVHTLTREMVAGAPLHEAVRSATGEPLYRVDEMWRDRFSLSSPIAWARLAGWDLMWLISALIGIVAMFVVRRRQRLRRDEIRAREVEDDALMRAIWEGRFGVR